MDYTPVPMVLIEHGGPEEWPVANLQRLSFGFLEHQLRVEIVSHIRRSGAVGLASAAADDDDDIVAGPGVDVHAAGAGAGADAGAAGNDDDDDDMVAGPGIDVHAAGLGAGLGHFPRDP